MPPTIDPAGLAQAVNLPVVPQVPARGDKPGLAYSASAPSASSAAGREDATGQKNMQQLIQLRWIAVAGQIITITTVFFGFDIHLPLDRMSAVLACLIVFNLASIFRWRDFREVTNGELLFALLVDVGTLTAQLYFSGGATNPFCFLYLLQVTIGAVLLRPWSVWTMLAVTIGCFIALTDFYRPLDLPPTLVGGLSSPYLTGLLICFVLDAVLLLVFVTRINTNLRARESRLADLRQRAAEEGHIVRMGLLASGAAHELGTPLSTLSVILGDWRHMKPFTRDGELMQEIDEMQTQLQRCKNIVSGILLLAGEARGESSQKTTVCTFLDDLVAEWRATRFAPILAYDNHFGDDLPMVSDSALKQMIGNVLDNAFEASPRWLALEVHRNETSLILTVMDEGPGFTPEMLSQFGTPYRSSKGRPGGGLGLFLVTNVARTLGGTVQASNRYEGGARVRMTLPLAAITLDEEEGRQAEQVERERQRERERGEGEGEGKGQSGGDSKGDDE